MQSYSIIESKQHYYIEKNVIISDSTPKDTICKPKIQQTGFVTFLYLHFSIQNCLPHTLKIVLKVLSSPLKLQIPSKNILSPLSHYGILLNCDPPLTTRTPGLTKTKHRWHNTVTKRNACFSKIELETLTHRKTSNVIPNHLH